MIKNKLKPIIVVEGTSDVNKLRLLVDCDFVTTNGSEISRETLSYLKLLSKERQIIILTDPDYPGMRIRNIINQEIKGCYNAFVSKDKSIKKHKVGVAECDKDEILKALENMIQYQEIESDEDLLKSQDILELGLCGKEDSFNKRKYLSEHYHLGPVNAKSLLKRLNMLRVSKKELVEVLNNYADCQ